MQLQGGWYKCQGNDQKVCGWLKVIQQNHFEWRNWAPGEINVKPKGKKQLIVSFKERYIKKCINSTLKYVISNR